MRRKIAATLGAASLATIAATGLANAAATLEAQYLFGNSLASSVAGAPDLTAVDPAGTSGYITDTVFGNSRTVYNFTGTNSPPASQGGLQFDNSGATVTNTNYSVDIVFSLNSRDGAWRRLIDVENRTSDAGFYVDPSNNLDLFPVSGGGNAFTTNAYHIVTLTVGTGGSVNAYLDGALAFTTTSNSMDIGQADDPGDLVNFFLDNTAGGGQGEWSGGNVAEILLYDGVLDGDQVTDLDRNPFPGTVDTNPVPEPTSLALFGMGLAAAVVLRRRRATRA